MRKFLHSLVLLLERCKALSRGDNCRESGTSSVSPGGQNLHPSSNVALYEFVCRTCGERFEVLVTGSRTPTCPSCQSTMLEKLVSSFGARTSASGPTATRSPFT
jgi:putative FmdB family regulatory protein